MAFFHECWILLLVSCKWLFFFIFCDSCLKPWPFTTPHSYLLFLRDRPHLIVRGNPDNSTFAHTVCRKTTPSFRIQCTGRIIFTSTCCRNSQILHWMTLHELFIFLQGNRLHIFAYAGGYKIWCNTKVNIVQGVLYYIYLFLYLWEV